MNPTIEIPITKADSDNFLLPSLKALFPAIASYRVVGTIVQSNAIGYILSLQVHGEEYQPSSPTRNGVTNGSNKSVTTPHHVFVKHVDATVYVKTKKSWNDLRRTLMYARTETRFYRDFAPLLRSAGFDAIPHHFAAEYSENNWIPNDEMATAHVDLQQTIELLPDPSQPRGGLLVLECIDDTTYFQDSPISTTHAKHCLSAMAKLHVSAWGNATLLQKAEQQLAKSSFHLDTRNPSELAGIESAWQHFTTEFKSALQSENLWTDSVRCLGQRIAVAAKYISRQLSPAPTDRYATLVHGDYKAMNVFLPRNDSSNNHCCSAKIVDYASTGIGFGMCDVSINTDKRLRGGCWL